MNVYIKLNDSTGIDTDNFSFFSLETSGGTETFLESGISRSQLVNVGYTLIGVDENATIIRVKSNTSICTDYQDIPINGI